MEKEIIKEVRELSKRTIDKLEEAIKSGDKEKALELHDKNVKGKQATHHFLIRLFNLTLAAIQKEGGDEAVYNFHKHFAKTFYPAVIREWKEGYKSNKLGLEDFPVDDFLRNRASLWEMVHDIPLQEWTEDEKTITFVLNPCESGGYLLRDQPDPLTLSEKPHVYCLNKKGFPMYCAHCTVMYEFGWYEEVGYPLFIYKVPEIGHGRCEMVYYKDPKEIPDEYYKERGLERKL